MGISSTLFSLYNMKFIQKDKQWLKAVNQYQTTNIEKENGEWIQSFDNPIRNFCVKNKNLKEYLHKKFYLQH